MTKKATNRKQKKVAKKLPMGIFEKVVGSKVYWILFTDKDGLRHREKCGSMSSAKARLSIRRSEKARGVETIVAPAAVKFSTLIDDAIQHTASESSTAHLSIVTYMYATIRAVFGERLVSSIKKSEIIDWLHKEATERKWSASTRNHYQYAMSKAFTVGIENEKIAIHPMKGIKRRREDNQRERQLSEAEETALRSAVAAKFPHFVAVIDFAIHSGTRASEMFRAKVGDYSPLTKMLTIHQTKVRTAPGIRYVPASPVLVDAYNELAKGKQLGEPLISKTKLQGSRDGSVAANRALKQTRYWFEQCRDDAKLVDFHWHDLRHTFASRLVAAGVPLATVSMYLGHQSIQMTMRYSHLIPGSGDAAVNALMNFYKKPVAAKAIGTNGKTVKSETAATFSVIRGGKEARTP